MNYLLYIDILGFSDIVRTDRGKIDLLYEIIDDLNAHRHPDFKTIIFSDTVLVTTNCVCKTQDDHRYATMYLIEFTQDLFYRVSKKGVFFRAVLDYGEFYYAPLKHGEKYYGEALINCYKLEKDINSIGTFITNRASKYQTIFPMERFSPDLQFVYFQQYYYRFFQDFYKTDISSWYWIDQHDYVYPIVREMITLKTIRNNSRRNACPKVRAKFLQYLDFYRKNYPWPLGIWESEGFSMNKIAPSDKWKAIYQKVLKEE